MAILIIEQQGKRHAGTLKGRVLIGRWPDNTVVIDDRAVSRIHAWIGLQDGRYYVADAGSRTGTFVNGDALRERHILQDGDQIRIGPALLRYRTDAAPPPDLATIDLSPRPAEQLSGEQGMFLDCVCGAPLWLPREFSGIGQCRYCGHTVKRDANAAGARPETARPAIKPATTPAPVAPPSEKPAPPIANAEQNLADEFDTVMDDAFANPRAQAAKAALKPPLKPKVPQNVPFTSHSAAPAVPPTLQSPKPAPVARTGPEQVCGVCHAPITVFDNATTCPACGLVFHADCWEENRGCSAYGCAQVGALDENR